MVLILLNILVISGLLASSDFGGDLLKTVSRSFSRIPDDIHHVTSGDQSHTNCQHDPTVQLVSESGYRPTPEMGYSRTHVKQAAKLERDGSASPSIEMKAVVIR